MTYKLLKYILFFLASSSLLAQTDPIFSRKSLEALLTNDINLAQLNNDSITSTELKKSIQWHIDEFKFGIKDSIVTSVDEHSMSNISDVLNLLKNAKVYDAKFFKKDSIIYDTYKKAITFSKEINDTTIIRFSYLKLLRHLFDNEELYDVLDYHLEEFKPYIKTIQDEAMFTYFKYTSLTDRTKIPYIEKYKAILKDFDTSDDFMTKGILNQIIGLTEVYINKDYSEGIKYMELARTNYSSADYGYSGKNKLFKVENNMGFIYNSQGNYKKALQYYRKMLKYDFDDYSLKSEYKLYWSMSKAFENLKQFDSALHYAKKEKVTKDLYNVHESASKQREIETIYQTAEKEKLLLQKDKELLIEQKKKRNNRNLLIASLALLLFGGITAFLLNKNIKRKQLLAEQGKELQTQKVATLLKEQELTAIDAMIEGQEKERQLIANDLHDDLGGLMTTVKWHFDALQKKQSPEMFEKTNNLIDEAYQKIRGIAHAKNSGVLASQGLLKAIRNMAHKISDSNNLTIEVIDHGLESRLENSLELTIFRIVQELIANAIKHANATEITIQITNHDDKLNIVVEDNGKGFDITKLSKTSGMGIHSIDKRIENLNGNVHIDSKVGQGTSVIIDIPT